MPKISACIVAYCDYDEVCAAVRSVLANTPGDDFALYVVDNASPDGCGPRLAQTDFGDVRVQVICLPKNLGFGKGHNSIMDRLTSDVHFILNPDIQLTADTLSDLADWMAAHPGVVMTRPGLTFPDGKPQQLPLRRCNVRAMVYRQLPCLRFWAKYNDRYLMADKDLTKPTEIEFCTGSFSAVDTAAFKAVGGFDEGYFMYVEDADLTQKVLQKGTVWLAPQFSAIHAWHRAPMRDAGKFKMQLVSMGRYFKKWGCGKGKV